MEYDFYVSGDAEMLKTKGTEHSALTGFQTVVRADDRFVITDSFYVARHTDSKEDTGGNCYDWYEIGRHYRYVDTTPLLRKAEADLDAMTVDQELRITLLELGLND